MQESARKNIIQKVLRWFHRSLQCY